MHKRGGSNLPDCITQVCEVNSLFFIEFAVSIASRRLCAHTQCTGIDVDGGGPARRYKMLVHFSFHFTRKWILKCADLQQLSIFKFDVGTRDGNF